MSSHFSLTPTSGSQWPQSQQPQPIPGLMHNGQSIHSQTPPPASSAQQQSQNMQNPMLAMMAMMQQMQQLTQQQPQIPSQTPTPVPVVPSPTQHNFPSPGLSDNRLIAQIIYEQTKRGKTYKTALESMHGHNGIMAYAWKDYFLENKEVIDALVENIRERNQQGSNSESTAASASPPPVSVSAPIERRASHARDKLRIDVVTRDQEGSITKRRRTKTTPTSSNVKVSREAIEKAIKDNEKKEEKDKKVEGSVRRSRRTVNSLSSYPGNTLLASVPPAVAIDPETGLPAAPSRSPSPPPAPQNSKYTEQEAIFFYRRVAYDLKRDPDLTKPALAEILNQKAPSRTAVAWRTFWSKHEDVADKMFLLTQLDDEDRAAVIRTWKGDTSKPEPAGRRRTSNNVSYKEDSDFEFPDDEDTASVEEVVKASIKSTTDNDDDDDVDDADDDDSIIYIRSTDEENDFGEAGSPFTKGEVAALARHIVATPGWYEGNKDWNTFGDKHRKRGLASWKVFYRRKAEEIDAVARKLMKRNKTVAKVKPQRGKPSWANDSSKGPNSASSDKTRPKRRLSIGDGKTLHNILLSNFDPISISFTFPDMDLG